jgi:hypothetical protein
MNELKKAWEEYLNSSDSDALLSAIERHANPVPLGATYPNFHRVCDLQIGFTSFRVSRLAADSETIFISPCDTPNFARTGVPYWLQGEQLQRWIRLETGLEEDDRFQAEADVDWNIFRE